MTGNVNKKRESNYLEDVNVMRKSRKVILERDQMMEDVINSFIMKMDTEEAVCLDR